MPTYRVVLPIGEMRVGRTPDQVLPAAVAGARELTEVEAWDVGIVRGLPRVTVRFTADDDDEAFRVAELTRARTNLVAQVLGVEVTRRWGSRFHPVTRRSDPW
ncbi:hypothetical protein ACTVCO_00185 [Sanguibacter sp. A247]|uniref:hypothetical protein n=1 Tax=unclassified Sanguibacter TaxID=2645534 RepID=UPI003FD83BC8